MRSLTESAARQFVQDWYAARDRHAPVETQLDFLARNGLVLRFPEMTVRSHDDFRTWYSDITARFFDEVHDVQKVDVTLTSPVHADLSTLVRWQARVREPGTARRHWLAFDTSVTCSLVLQDGAVRIRTYGIDDMAPMPGSALL